MNITFIGGGNMASALIGGLLQQDFSPAQLCVVEISPEGREKLQNAFSVQTVAGSCPGRRAWRSHSPRGKTPAIVRAGARACAAARKPSGNFHRRRYPRHRYMPLAGGHSRIVRAMPNTPALIRAAVTGLYAMPGITSGGETQRGGCTWRGRLGALGREGRNCWTR